MNLRHIPRDASRAIRQTLGIPQKSYWQRRRNSVYLQAVRRLVRSVGADAESILDVGSNGCGYLDWFDWIPRRVSIDIRNPYSGPGVEGVRADFLTHRFTERFDLVLCLQVLEHIPDAHRFAQRLLAGARHRVIVSVPYRWAADRSAHHVHDPVDEDKMLRWFGRQPISTGIAREWRWTRTERMICVYAPD
jgi:hypothetical protein